MMKIGLYHNLPAGGARRHTFEQVRELAQRGYEIHEFTHSTADLSFMPFDGYVAETRVFDLRWDALRPLPVRGVSPYIHLLRNRANLKRLDRQCGEIARAIDAEGFDLAFVKDCRFTVAPYLLRYLKTPSVFYMHSDTAFRSRGEIEIPPSPLERFGTWPKRLHEQMVYDEFIVNIRGAGRVLTNSRFTQERILARHGVASSVIYPGVDLDTFHPGSLATKDSYVLSAGILHPQKGHWFVIESLGLLRPEIRPRLVVASPVAENNTAQQLRDYAATHGVELDIQTVRDSDRMAQLYSGAMLLLFAPHEETLGLVALEAMACGTPVVGVGEGGLVETIEDGRTGLLVERDAGEFALAVEKLLVDSALRGLLGRQSHRYIKQFWTWSRAVDDLEQAFGHVRPVCEV